MVAPPIIFRTARLNPVVILGQADSSTNAPATPASGAGAPAPGGDVNADEKKLAELKLPENPHLFVDASDVAGSRQVLYVPLKTK